MLDYLILLSERDKRKYLDSCQIKLDSFVKDLNLITGLFEELQAEAPLPSYANFRDALFHFLKIRSLGDEVQVLQEIYAMDEHLHRSLKDTVISLFQRLSVQIEYLMRIPELNREHIVATLATDAKLLLDSNKDVVSLKRTLENPENKISIEEASKLLLVYFSEASCPNNIHIFRKVIHAIKNECFDIRSVSLSIERVLSSDKNAEFYKDFYFCVTEELRGCGMFEYVPYAYMMHKTAKAL